MFTKQAREWVRWLHAGGLGPGAIAFTLDLAEAEVRAFLEWDRVPGKVGRTPRCGRPRRRGTGCRAAVATYVRRLHELGFGLGRIAELTGRDPSKLAGFLSPPDPTRPIKGVLAGRVRLMHAAGIDAPQIAAELALDAVAVTELLRRLDAPRPPRPGRYKPRPRPPSEWGDDDDLVNADGSGTMSAEHRAGDAGDVAGPQSKVQSYAAFKDEPVEAREASWGPFQEHWPTGSRATAAKLSADDARRARELRAEGLTLRELSEYFEVSMATVGRLLRGDTYRDVAPQAEDFDEPQPAIALPETAPQPARRPEWHDNWCISGDD